MTSDKLRKTHLKKSTSILAATVFFLVGCSQQPSSNDAKDALNNILHNSCTLAEVTKFEKINGIEKAIDGNKYYSIDAKFDITIKYDEEWSNKYLEFNRETESRKAQYNLAMTKVDKILNEDVKVYQEKFKPKFERMDNVSAEIQKIRQGANYFNMEAEERLNYNNLLSISSTDTSILRNESEQDWKIVENKFTEVIEGYNNAIGVDKKIASHGKDIEIYKSGRDSRYQSYKVPYDFSNRKMQPDAPKGCGLYADGFAGELLRTTILSVMQSSQKSITPDRLYEGISQSLSMSMLLQKSENGWIIAR